MFNKTAIIKNQKTNFLYKSRPKLHKNNYMRKTLSNSKTSYALNNNSTNTSNINLRTSSNSKLTPESASIRKVKTQIKPVIKKSLFDEKDKKNQFFRNFSTKKSSINNNPYCNISLSAKINKHFKIRSRTHLNTEENEIQNKNKGYYLTGELPFRDTYIIEMKDCNPNLNVSKKSENKKTINSNKNKNEFIQCDSINNKIYQNKMLNMRKKDKKIEKLARKLIIKLNLDDKKNSNKQPKCGCGNLITLKNGFFNGVNLVMSYSPPKKQKKPNLEITNNNSDNKNENDKVIYNQTQPDILYNDGYNFIPTNLPLFLRDKYNIKGTKVLSPFCIEARDEFLFKKIFNDGERKKLPNKYTIIDNKLNIFYADNHIQYNKNLMKHNAKLKKKGRKILHEVGPSSTEVKLNSIKSKMNFMKKIVDYAYPNMVLARVRESEKVYKKKNVSEIKLPPFKKAELSEKQRNNMIGNFLRQSINVQNF